VNRYDASGLPISTALNLHPLHRQQGTVVLRAEVEEALHDLSMKPIQLPDAKLIDAYQVERILAESGISPDLVRHET
jgi:hypothetical protein